MARPTGAASATYLNHNNNMNERLGSHVAEADYLNSTNDKLDSELVDQNEEHFRYDYNPAADANANEMLPEEHLINRARFKLFMSEFLATFVLVYLSQCSVASYELIGTQNDTLNRQLATIMAQGLAYLFACLLTLNLSGAHLNPAYTFACASFGQLGWGRAVIYVCAQYLGAFVAAIFLHATYSDKLAQRHSEGLLLGLNSSLKAHGNILSTGKLFSSYPPTEVSLTQLTISYTLATAHLMLLLQAISESKLVRVARCLRPIYSAGALCLVLAAFSANGGPVWNPAQDFSPRLYIALFGWGSPAFNLYNNKYWLLCGLVAPHLGALVGFALYRLFDHLRRIPHEPRQMFGLPSRLNYGREYY